MFKSNKVIKGQLSLECNYQRQLVNGEFKETSMYCSLSAEDIFNIDDFITNQFQKLILREKLNQPNVGSGWSLLRCNQLNLKLNKNNSLNMGSYIELPEIIKKAFVYFKSNDEFCFIYSIRCAIDKPKKDAERVKQYERFITAPIFSGFEHPLSLRDIRIFERRSFNKFEGYLNISINVYTFDNNGVITHLQISKIYDAELEISLLSEEML